MRLPVYCVVVLTVLTGCNALLGIHDLDPTAPGDAPSSDHDATPDSGSNTLTGSHSHYVVNSIVVPTTASEANMFALDIGAAKSNTLDGAPDNQLGHVFASLNGQGFAFNAAIGSAVARGDILLLADVQTPSFVNAGTAGFQTFLGDDPSPQPCLSGTDTTCGQQFDNGSFGLAPTSPKNPPLVGPLTNGAFDGGPGTIAIQIALIGTQPLNLTLSSARIHAAAVDSSKLTDVILDGAVPVTELDSQLIPAMQVEFTAEIARDCTALTSPPNCGCASGTNGATLLDLFDGDLSGSTKDCAVSVTEISGNQLIKSLLSPDVCVETTCDMPDALSFGLELSAVAATFSVPGE